MSYGPIYPISAFPNDTTGNIFPSFYAGDTHHEGLGVVASLGADATWELTYQCPPTIPTGTLKLDLRCITTDNTNPHVAKFTVSDINVAASTGGLTGLSFNAETQTTVTFAAQANKSIQTKITLTTAPSGGDFVLVKIACNHTGWTVNQILYMFAGLIWE